MICVLLLAGIIIRSNQINNWCIKSLLFLKENVVITLTSFLQVKKMYYPLKKLLEGQRRQNT